MPYIAQERRKDFDELLAQLGPRIKNKGEMNYCVSILMAWYVSVHGDSYQNISDAKDALVNAADEFSRLRLAPYEDIKRKENGELTLPDRETKIEFKVLDEDNGYPD